MKKKCVSVFVHVCVRLNTRSAERFEWEQMLFCLRGIKREVREQKSFLEMHEQLCHILSYGTVIQVFHLLCKD